MNHEPFLLVMPQIILATIVLVITLRAHNDVGKIYILNPRKARHLCCYTHVAVLMLAAFCLSKVFWLMSQVSDYTFTPSHLTGEIWDFLIIICMLRWSQQITNVARSIIEGAAAEEMRRNSPKKPCRPCPWRGEGGEDEIVLLPDCQCGEPGCAQVDESERGASE